MKKLVEVTIRVPYRSAGNVIRQNEVTFEVFKNQEQYQLKPLLSETERRLANLPDMLHFQFTNGKPVSSKGNKDGNFHIIQDVAGKLKAQNIVG